ncbi:hypothetical protein Tsubulata_008533 [Turnera subulata]|uniref:Uncharacterized protein n=1 Tax=Turnera subulata TaxID=218843 RepID=A0A9Q0F9G8_9ROSI|nr:hypothetical protein Tsubulata_008533 [Turnera subulata]
MVYNYAQKFLQGGKYFHSKRPGAVCLHLMLYHSSGQSHEEVLPLDWYEKAYPKIMKLTHLLKNVDLIDGRLVNIKDDSIIANDFIQSKMQTFKSLVRVFIGSPFVQQRLRQDFEGLGADKECNHPIATFSKPEERQPVNVNSLTKVGDFLSVSAQRRKVVRFTVCAQVTPSRIWTGALKEILSELKLEMDSLNYEYYSGSGKNMAPQIISSCLKFLTDADISYAEDSTSWMRLAPSKRGDSTNSSTWGDVLEMFNDLIGCLKSEKWLTYHVAKLEVMKEGLSQIKDVLIDKSVGYKEARHQENLVHKKLSKTLGHSSRCLFTLLLYYLYGHVRDIEIDLSGGVYSSNGGNKFCLSMGRILTSEEEKIVWSGVKQLDRALGLYKFVWETAKMKGDLELQGHLWCVGAKNRILSYKGNSFFLHGISL